MTSDATNSVCCGKTARGVEIKKTKPEWLGQFDLINFFPSYCDQVVGMTSQNSYKHYDKTVVGKLEQYENILAKRRHP